MGPKQDAEVLGLLIDEDLPVDKPLEKGLFVDVNVKLADLSTVRRLQRLVNTATTAHDKMVMDENASLVVHLPAAGYGTTEFEMSDARRDAIVDAGRRAMARYFDEPRPPRSVEKGMVVGEPGGAAPADRIAARLLA